MPWATPEDVRPLVGPEIGVAEPDLADAWAGRLTLAVPQARREIETALKERGYAAAQVLACDWLFEEHQELALVAALLKGGSLAEYDVGVFERRYERIVARLKSQPVYVGGQPVFPAATTADGQPAAVAGGQMTGALPRRDWGRLDL